MRRRRDLLVLAVTAGLVLAITLGPLVVEVIQVVRTPPPQHPSLVLFGIIGEALDRLGWSLGVAAVVLVVRWVVNTIRSRSTRRLRGIRLLSFWWEGPAGGRARAQHYD